METGEYGEGGNPPPLHLSNHQNQEIHRVFTPNTQSNTSQNKAKTPTTMNKNVPKSNNRVQKSYKTNENNLQINVQKALAIVGNESNIKDTTTIPMIYENESEQNVTPVQASDDKRAQTNDITLEEKLQNKLKLRYDSKNTGPYLVCVESKNKNLGRLHPMTIGKILNEINGNYNLTEISSMGKNKIKLQYKTGEAANNFLNSKALEAKNLIAYAPPERIIRLGVIKNVDSTLTDTEIKDNIRSNIDIQSIKRIMKKTSENAFSPTQSVIVAFKGQLLPSHISIHYVRCPVEPYVQRVLQCFNCCKYGHIGKQCKSKITCPRCSENHKLQDCNNNITKCIHCNKNHLSTDKSCEEYQIQKTIKQIMAQENISYFEAKLIIKGQTFAQVTSKENNTLTDDRNHFPALKTTQEEENPGPYSIQLPKQYIQPNNTSKHIKFTSREVKKTNPLTEKQQFPTISRDYEQDLRGKIGQNPYAPQFNDVNNTKNKESTNRNNSEQNNVSEGSIYMIIDLLQNIIKKNPLSLSIVNKIESLIKDLCNGY